jgi:hypothetical protein
LCRENRAFHAHAVETLAREGIRGNAEGHADNSKRDLARQLCCDHA